MTWYIGFDIETSGPRYDNDIIALGMAVRDENGREIDRLLVKNYFPNETNFEKKCWDEFWSKRTSLLKTFKYKGTLDKEANTKRLINEFINFRKKYESIAQERGIEILLVTDNKLFDGGFINYLITKYTNENTLPCSALTGEYCQMIETTSAVCGLIKFIDKTDKNNWGVYKRLNELYNLPRCDVSHNHQPDNDASVIAHNMYLLDQISLGKIKKRKDLQKT